MVIDYNYNAISESLNAMIDSVHDIDPATGIDSCKLAKCDEYTDQTEFSSLSSYVSNVVPLNIDQRIKTYTNYIQALLLSKDTNSDNYGTVRIPDDKGNNIELKGRSSDFTMATIASFEGNRVPADEEVSLQNIYSKDSKVKQITDSIIEVFQNSFDTATVPINVNKIDEDFETKINSGCIHKKPNNIIFKNSSLIEVADIINSLIEFKLELEKIRIMNINYVLEKTVLTNGLFWMFSYNGCVYDSHDEYVGGMRSKIIVNYGPYTKKITSNLLENIWNSTAQYEKTNTQIKLKNLVKIEDINSDDVNFDITNIEGINGFAEQYKIADSNDRFDIMSYQDFENTYSLIAGKVMSKYKILQAIDAIFYKWISNIKTITYNVYLCHYNCHGNNMFINYDGDCCFCGNCNFGSTTECD